MGMGGNRDYFLGINGNCTIVQDIPRPGIEMGMKSWEWDEMDKRNSFPHLSKKTKPEM